MGSDNANNLAWPLGRVLYLIPGTDGVVRLKKACGEYLRPVQKLYLLEVCEDEKYGRHLMMKIEGFLVTCGGGSCCIGGATSDSIPLWDTCESYKSLRRVRNAVDVLHPQGERMIRTSIANFVLYR